MRQLKNNYKIMNIDEEKFHWQTVNLCNGKTHFDI
jgi:hypothetical protein